MHIMNLGSNNGVRICALSHNIFFPALKGWGGCLKLRTNVPPSFQDRGCREEDMIRDLLYYLNFREFRGHVGTCGSILNF